MKNVAYLPVKNGEYQNMVLMTDFLARMRGFFELEKLKKYKFSPQLNGYEITFDYKDAEAKIEIERKKNPFGKSIKINAEIKCSDGETVRKEFKTRTPEDNEAAMRQIIADCR